MSNSPKLLKTRKEKITALLLVLSSLASILFFIYGVTQSIEAQKLNEELMKCRGIEVSE
jgi:hypothetical protein